MHARHIYFILQLVVFGIGAGLRYIFFLIIGKRKTYDDLITPTSQDKWNVLIGFIVAIVIIFLAIKFSPSTTNTSYPYSKTR